MSVDVIWGCVWNSNSCGVQKKPKKKKIVREEEEKIDCSILTWLSTISVGQVYFFSESITIKKKFF